jgi:DivIVA domain-containing protein
MWHCRSWRHSDATLLHEGPWHHAGVGIIIVVLVGVVLVLGLSLVLTLNEGGLGSETEDHADLGLPPERLLTADDVAALRFRTGARGYRMADVDAALERIAQTLRAVQQSSDS